jgi:hypothetical protein
MREFFDELTGESRGVTASVLVGAWPENHWKSLLSLFLGDSSSPEEECRPIWEAGKESPRSNKTGDPTYIWHCSDKPVSIRERGRKQSSGAVDKLALKDIAGAGVSFESWWQNVTLIIAPRMKVLPTAPASSCLISIPSARAG